MQGCCIKDAYLECPRIQNFFEIIKHNQQLGAKRTVPARSGWMLAYCLGGVVFACIADETRAAPPDAGLILDAVQPPASAPATSTPSIEVQSPAQPALTPPSNLEVTVKAFRVVGATVFTEQELLVLLQSFQDRPLGLVELEQAAATITRFYRSHGYPVARAYMPAQRIKDGIVEIVVLEGRVGRVDVQMKNPDGRLTLVGAQAVMSGSVKPGEPVRRDDIERGLLLLDDLPGMAVKSTLVPGASVGTSDLIVEAYEAYWINGSVEADNFGNRYTDRARLGATFNLDNPARAGDRLSLRVLSSGSRMNYARLSYLSPVGVRGTKFGAAYSRVTYKLGREFESLDADGVAEVAGLFVLHPVERTRRFSLFGTLGFDRKTFTNRAGGAVTSDKSADLFSVGTSGESRDFAGGGGVNSFDASFAGGRLDLGGSAGDQAADAASARTEGRFYKLGYRAARLQRLTEEVSFYAAWQGQRASTNLDSSEKFVLGGPLGVRAYPQGEASADEANLLNLELRWDTTAAWARGHFQWAVFVDAGRARLHKETWVGWEGGNTQLPNVYSLYGTGFALGWSERDRYWLRASYAHKLGHNPGRDGNDRDSDNTDDDGRFWLQAVTWF